MKKTSGILSLSALLAISMTSCMGWSTTASVDGGSGWFAGDYAPYYWSDWNDWAPAPPPPVIYPPGSMRPGNPGPGHHPVRPPQNNRPPQSNRPGNVLPGNPGDWTKPTPPPPGANRPGTNPGTPRQGGFRGQK